MKFLNIILCLCLSSTLHAQNAWSLEACINYAVKNNIQIQQAQLNKKLSELQVAQNKYAQYPSLNMDINNGISFGRSVDPTTNSFIRSSYFFNGISANASALLFGWFARKNALIQSKLEVQAIQEGNLQLQNDVSLNIAVGYLRVVMAKEQVNINKLQLSNNLVQLNNTTLRVKAGNLPELNKAQMLAQVSADSLNLLSSELDVNNFLLDLRALLNLDYTTPFDVLLPENIDLNKEALATYPNEEEIFKIARHNQYRLASDITKIKSAGKQIEIAKAAQYPQLSISGSMGTNFASTVKDITGYTYKGEEPIGNLIFGDTLVPVTRPTYNFETKTQPLLKQYDNNLRQTIALGIQVPIFNGYNAKLNVKRAQLNYESALLTLKQDELKLQQDIYRAYNDAKASILKYNASLRTTSASKAAVDFATKRYDVGMLNTQEYTNQQNIHQRNAVLSVQAKYDAIFKLKVLDFYLGNTLKL